MTSLPPLPKVPPGVVIERSADGMMTTVDNSRHTIESLTEFAMAYGQLCYDAGIEAIAAQAQPTLSAYDARDMVSRHQKACIEFAMAPNLAERDECHKEMITARLLLVTYLTQHAPERLVRPTPLTCLQIVEVALDAGYTVAGDQGRADFICGIHHCEQAHGISAPVVPTPTEITEE